jgi:putative transposase
VRVEPYTVGSYLHVVKRGARGMDIVRNEHDKWRFVRSLYYLNDTFLYPHWDADTSHSLFTRPSSWPKQEPIVDIIAYTLMPNHFHLILKETHEGGISRFMWKLGQSMTNYFNEKYEEQGSLFQGAYRSRTVHSDEYFRYVASYVMVKNTFELYPFGGLAAAQQNFEQAWQWAVKYPFSSVGDYTGVRTASLILQKGLLGELFDSDSFKNFSREVIEGGKWKKDQKDLELSSQTN